MAVSVSTCLETRSALKELPRDRVTGMLEQNNNKGQGELNRLTTDGKSGCRHKTDKVVNPKGGVRKSHSGKRQRNLSKCSNCGDPDHTANLCPIARKRLKMAPKSNGRRKGEQFPVDDFDSMWDLN